MLMFIHQYRKISQVLDSSFFLFFFIIFTSFVKNPLNMRSNNQTAVDVYTDNINVYQHEAEYHSEN